jgi:hypothetical protein
VGLNAITKEAWNTANNTEDKREKIQVLSLAKECHSMKLDLLTNATVVDDAIKQYRIKRNYYKVTQYRIKRMTSKDSQLNGILHEYCNC